MSLLTEDFNQELSNEQSIISNGSPPRSVHSKSSSSSLKAFIGLLNVNNVNNIHTKAKQSKPTPLHVKVNPPASSNIKAKFEELVTETKTPSHKHKGTILNKVQRMRNTIEKTYNTINIPYYGKEYNNGNNDFQIKTKRMLIGLKSKKMEDEIDIEDFKHQFEYSDQKRNPFGLREFERKFMKGSLQRERKVSKTIVVNSNNSNSGNNMYNSNWFIRNMFYLNTQQSN